MRCSSCQHENLAGMKFCGQCAGPLAGICPACGGSNPPENRFCGQCAAPLSAATVAKFSGPDSYTPKHLAERILTSKAALEGERKQVTVLFADLKGSMELLADRDPEEARKILDPVLEHMMEAVHRYEGTVNQVMGDGIMALFGAPLAHEDHAVRACYAALRMQDVVRRYSEELRRAQGVEVQIRVGVNSGEVVVRTIGSDLWRRVSTSPAPPSPDLPLPPRNCPGTPLQKRRRRRQPHPAATAAVCATLASLDHSPISSPPSPQASKSNGAASAPWRPP